jgi:hypothetical protein
MSAYQNKSSQAEREAILRNDRANTFAGRAQAEADEIQGRWAQEHKATVTGTGPVEYPMVAPNWSVDPTGVEPPLGMDVNTVEPCGEKFEIDALGDVTTEAVRVGPQSASPLAAAVAPSEVPASPADVERAAANPTPKRRE